MTIPTLLLETPRRMRLGSPTRVPVERYIERRRLPLWDGLLVMVVRRIRRLAFRTVRWTQHMEARAYARAMWED